MTARRLSAFEALGRGLANLRGNLALVAASALGALVVLGLALLSLLPMLTLVGLSLADLAAGAEGPRAVRAIQDFDAARLFSGEALVAALLLLAGLTLASLVQCWFQAGILGVLAAGDAQAPPGPRRPALAFRTFSPRFFSAEAARLFGRVLAFYMLVLGAVIAGLAVVLALVVIAASAAGRWGGGAAFAVGCGGAIPLLFGFFVLALAASFGQADLPRVGGSARAALATGLRTLSQRMGSSLGLYLLFLTAAIAVGVFQGGLNLASGAAFGSASPAGATAEVALFGFQTFAQALLGVALAATAIALVRAECAAAEPEG